MKIRGQKESNFRNKISNVIFNFISLNYTYKIQYISLGLNCLPRKHYTNNKLMKTKKDGYKSCPFDLMISSYEGIFNLIENNFKNFFDI